CPSSQVWDSKVTDDRDVIRRHALGSFRDMLQASAKSVAMLAYLNNDSSTKTSPNENYGRELLELHTVGIEAGYTEREMRDSALVFTGWTYDKTTRLFSFRSDWHWTGRLSVLGWASANASVTSGQAVGESYLNYLATHPMTARRIARKLAVRFVSDHPPQALIDRLTDVYLTTHGDVPRMIVAIAESPEFWGRDAVGSKIKSPFELTASALRVTGGEIIEPRAILQWINRMGQPLYAYQAPTGYPDRAEAWVNTGSLLNRMNFGLQLAANRVKGVSLDLPALNGGREPASREEALRTYAALLMPGRDLTATLKQLTPMVADPGLAKRVDQAAPKEAAKAAKKGDPNEDLLDSVPEMATQMPRSVKVRGMLGDEPKPPVDKRPPTSLEQVVGVILGSPEFQRR
ncbi:MAG TPA: DUF1800 domain-containing protein, partial [Thermoanaerobaculia bacterium]